MTANLRARLFANPWWIVFGSTIALTVAHAPISLFTFGLFMKPLGAEFGWNRGQLSTAHGLASIFLAIGAPIVGLLIDRFGVRRVLIPVLFLFAANLVALSFTNSLLMFTILYSMQGGLGVGQGPISYVKSISSFFDQRRGLALGIAIAGIGVGATCVPLFASYMITHHGWRAAYIGLAGLLMIIALPSVWLFVRDPAEAASAAPSEGIDVLPGLQVGEALRTRTFWLFAPAAFLSGTAVLGIVVHLAPLLTDHGFSPGFTAGMLSAVGLATMCGRVLSGYLLDRFFAPHVGAVFFLLPIVSLFLLVNEQAPLLAVILLGLASGVEIDLISYVTGRYFGLKRFGQIFGYLFAVFSLGSGFGPFVLGAAFVRFGSYDQAFIGFGVILLIAAVLIMGLGRYVYPARR